VGAAQAPEFGLFAQGPRAFPSLIADPREPQLSLRAAVPTSREVQGEVALGELFSVYKWSLGSEDRFIQWLAGGGVFSRFDLLKSTKDLQVSDYTANMPVDVRLNRRWSGRVMPFHISSHLGDDFIVETGRLPRKYSVDSVKTLLALEPDPQWRLYGGYQYVIRSVNENFGRHAVQSGIEWKSAWRGSLPRWQTFAAQDLQSWQRVGWNIQYHAQVGIRLKRTEHASQAMNYYLEFATGRRPFGQFYKEKETLWALGFRFHI